ncbi:MAG TPA: methyltransferase domain-containing protein, partial [Blastocatellia bacterium]|nr:methyltransferase domain-containing protein [Blastocatellia bacterium]
TNMLTPDRIYEEELLDAGEGTDEDVRKNLLDLRRINRLLGGTRVVLSAIEGALKQEPADRFSLLDVGTGSADIPSSVCRWSRERGLEPRIVGLDLSERNMRIARRHLGINRDVELVRADALFLPFAPRSFDFVSASLFLHHFREDDIVRLLEAFAAIARRAVIVNDLVRNLVPYYFIRATGPLFATSYLTRNDGPVSVLRGFTAAELKQLGQRAGLSRLSVRRHFPYRLSLIADVHR